VTRTKPSDFPSLLRAKLSTTQTVVRHEIRTDQVDPNMDCPSCGTTGIRYSEVQLRSADEGSTIIYNCECGHKYGIPDYLVVSRFANLSQVEYEQLIELQVHNKSTNHILGPLGIRQLRIQLPTPNV
jgi:DNA-directed RNA polymerase I subunit RPA12